MRLGRTHWQVMGTVAPEALWTRSHRDDLTSNAPGDTVPRCTTRSAKSYDAAWNLRRVRVVTSCLVQSEGISTATMV